MDKLAKDITQAASDQQICSALKELYRELEQQTLELDAICQRCGNCCRFEQFGQELLASTAEVGYLLAWLRKQPSMLKKSLTKRAPHSHKLCPFLENDSCALREARVLGCRVFFCQAEGPKKQQMADIYETYHKRIQDLHEQRGLSYNYLLWPRAIRAISELECAGKSLPEEELERCSLEGYLADRSFGAP